MKAPERITNVASCKDEPPGSLFWSRGFRSKVRMARQLVEEFTEHVIHRTEKGSTGAVVPPVNAIGPCGRVRVQLDHRRAAIPSCRGILRLSLAQQFAVRPTRDRGHVHAGASHGPKCPAACGTDHVHRKPHWG